jgi:hypothetical protein
VLQELEIKGFKGFFSMRTKSFSQVNLITGANNVGKTALLEALALFLKHGLVDETILRLREIQPNDDSLKEWTRWVMGDGNDWLTLRGQFSDRHDSDRLGFHRDHNVELAEAELARRIGPADSFSKILILPGLFGRSRYYEKQAAPVSTVSCWPAESATLLKQFETLLLSPQAEQRIESWLRRLDPRINGLRSLEISGSRRQLYVDIGAANRIPLAQFGQGVQRLIQIVTAAQECAGGFLLIDEIESGIHHSFLRSLWETIFDIAFQSKIQIFLTTHSYECLQSAAMVANELEGQQLAIHRLERRGQDIVCVSAGEETLVAAIESGFEVR